MSVKSNPLHQDREKNVFIGINYETGEPVLNEIRNVLKEMGFTPKIAKDYPSAPDKIYEKSMQLLSQCEYAIFEITDPAGQLMELERSLQQSGLKKFVYYSSVHISAMPLTFAKTLQRWYMGDIFRYTTFTTLRKCIKATLVNDSPNKKDKSLEEKARYILGIRSEKKYKEENVVLILSMGTLKKQLKEEGGLNAINEFRGVKILITGWDKSSLEKMMEDSAIEWDKWYVVSEHCILCSPTKINRNFKLEIESCKNFYDEKGIEMDYVRKCNKIVIESILDYSKNTEREVTFWSQGDEAGICYYLNPPLEVKNRIRSSGASSDVTTGDFLQELNTTFSLWFKIDEEPSDNPATLKFSVQDEGAKELLLYAIVKTNAKLRRFLPYTIKITPPEFSWGDVAGEDDNRLKEFLMETLGADWVKNAKITKSGNKTLAVFDEEGNSLSLTLNEEEKTVTLVDDVPYKFIAKEEGGKLKIYPHKQTVIFTLKSKEEERKSDEEFFPEDLKKIKGKVLEKIDEMYKENYELFSKYIQPQEDICIDIFCKTKDEVIEEILKKIIGNSAQEESLIVYVSTGRETDIPMILKCYELNYNFIAIGESSISEKLKNVGVLPVGGSLNAIIRFIQNNFLLKDK